MRVCTVDACAQRVSSTSHRPLRGFADRLLLAWPQHGVEEQSGRLEQERGFGREQVELEPVRQGLRVLLLARGGRRAAQQVR